MQDYASKELSRFVEAISPFRELWQSVLVRATWANLDGKDRILALSITLEEKSPKELPAPEFRPDVGPLRTSWEARGIDELEAIFFKELASGTIKIEGHQLALENHNGSQWTGWSSLHSSFERPGEYAHSSTRLPMVRVHGSNSGNNSAYDHVKDFAITLQLRALKVPFESVQDVQESFLGIPRSQRDQNIILVEVQANIPIALEPETSIQDGKLSVSVAMSARADAKKVSIGLIESAPDRVIRRLSLPLKAAEGTRGRVATIEHEIADGVTKANVFLNYAGIFLGQKLLLALRSNTDNPLMRLHESVDPENEELMKCLSGQGKDKAEDFERGVSWLLGFCGFRAELLAHFPPLEEDAPDLIAYSPEAQVVFGIECTTAHPQTLGKMPKLVTRCRRLQEALKDNGIVVIPVLATALDEVSQSERETAAQDKIALLTQKDLLELLQLAGAGKDQQDIIAEIRTHLPKETAGLEGLTGW